MAGIGIDQLLLDMLRMWIQVVLVALNSAGSYAAFSHLTSCGDIQLGGLFSIHYSSISESNQRPVNTTCDDRFQHSVLLVEAMKFAIQTINEDITILKDKDHGKITLGYDILGSCDDSYENMFYALEEYTNLEDKLEEFETPCEGGNCKIESCNGTRDPISALIGPPTTADSAAIASLFRLYGIPLISYDASSPELGDHDRFPSFFRTIFGDNEQAEALVGLVDSLGWNYIAVVGSDDTVGKQGIHAFKEELSTKSGKCVSKEAYFAPNGNDTELREVVNSLKSIEQEEGFNVTANVTLLFMGYGPAVRFLAMAHELGLNHITWIGVDDWTSNFTITWNVSGQNPAIYLPGTITTQIPHHTPHLYQEWVSGFLRMRLLKNPWLFQYFCEQCSIRFLNASGRGFGPSITCTVEFVWGEKCLNYMNPAKLVSEQRRISNVIEAVYAAAYALDHMMRMGQLNRDNRTNQYYLDYNDLLAALHSLSISKVPALKGDDAAPVIEFDKNGNIRKARYQVYSYNNTSAPVRVGNWLDEPDRLELNKSLIYWKTANGQKPISQCSELCQRGYRTIFGPAKCCWKCERCPDGHFTNRTQMTACLLCPEHFHTSENQTECLPNTLTYVKIDQTLGILNIVFSVIGEIAVWISAIIVVSYREHPMFHEDRYILLLALIPNCALGYTYFIFHTTPPTMTTCSIRRVIWQVTVVMTCSGGFFSIVLGKRLCKKLFRSLKTVGVNEDLMPLFGYWLFVLLATILYVIFVYVFPPAITLTDLAEVTGEKGETYKDCDDLNNLWLLGLSGIMPGVFWIVTLCWTLRENKRRKQNQNLDSSRLERDSAIRRDKHNKKRIDNLHVVAITYSSYVILLIVGSLLPIYATLSDPWSRNFMLLMGGFTAISVVLGFVILPRAKTAIFDQYQGLSRRDSMGGVYIVSGGTMHRIGN